MTSLVQSAIRSVAEARRLLKIYYVSNTNLWISDLAIVLALIN